jgi:hypothetical protein
MAYKVNNMDKITLGFKFLLFAEQTQGLADQEGALPLEPHLWLFLFSVWSFSLGLASDSDLPTIYFLLCS